MWPVTALLFYVCMYIGPINGIGQVLDPASVLHAVESSCVFVTTEHATEVTTAVIEELQNVTFTSEETILFGTIFLRSFFWPGGINLTWECKPHFPESNAKPEVAMFIKFKKDRTCLLSDTFNVNMPSIQCYRDLLTVDSITDYINHMCGTYRSPKGHLSVPGLHREEILNTLYHVETDTNVSIAKLAGIEELQQCKKEGHECSTDQREKNLRKNINSLKYRQAEHLFNNKNIKAKECDRISIPSREEFFHNYLKISKPVIIKGGLTHWKAMTKWTNKYLRHEYGANDIHVKLTPGGEFEGVEQASLWEEYDRFKIPTAVLSQLLYPDLVVVRPATAKMNFSTFLDIVEMVSNGSKVNISAYLEYSSIPQYMPELEQDIDEMPFIKQLLNRKHLNIWLSDGNTLGKLHFDPFDNFLCQVSGVKSVRLFEPHDNTRLYEGHIPEAMLSHDKNTNSFRRKTLMDSTSMVMSPVDILKTDFQRFPKFADVFPLNCTIGEGDVLFMPAFWWHEVQSSPSSETHRNLAVNYWYEPFLIREFPCPECKLDINDAYRHLL